MELLFDLLEELPFQSVPGSEVMPNTTVSRQPLASTSSFASEDSYLSDSSINAGAGTGNILLDQFADINLLLAQQNQVNAQPLSALPVLSVDGVGCQRNYSALNNDEMWNSNHSSSGPTTVVASQMDASDRAPVFADMGKSPSPDRAHDSGPATKRARLSSDDSISTVLDDLERRREKNNEACRKARHNKKTKEVEMKEKAQTLEKENEKLRKTIAKLEKKVNEEKAKFLKAMTMSS
ncbi:uncharacterized protein [Apostichopus japonicus]